MRFFSFYACLFFYWLIFSVMLAVGGVYSDSVASIAPLVLVSLFVFLGLLFVSLISLKLWVFCLPIVVIFLPNLVNDIFPSFPMGPSSEVITADYSVISHIDVYFMALAFHLFRLSSSLKFESKDLLFVFLTLIVFIVYLISSIRYFDSPDLFGLFLSGTYQIRYFYYGLLFAIVFDFRRHFQYFVLGVVVGLAFLCVESVIYSVSQNNARLSSGNYGVNVFANALVLISVYLLLCTKRLKKEVKIIIYTSVILALICILLSGTRVALFSIFVGLTFYSVLLCADRGSVNLRFVASVLLILVPLTFCIYFVVAYFDIMYKYFGHEAMSSLVTRGTLWVSSIEIFSKNVLGAGNLMFNVLRYEIYDVPILLDPHSDYFGFLVSYGFFGVLVWPAFVIYVFCSTIKLSRSHFAFWSYKFTVYFSLSVLFVSSITNSNFQKHQLFMLCIILFFSAFRESSNLIFIRNQK